MEATWAGEDQVSDLGSNVPVHFKIIFAELWDIIGLQNVPADKGGRAFTTFFVPRLKSLKVYLV